MITIKQDPNLVSPIRPIYNISAATHKLHLGHRTLIMGILNVTPDSFSLDGCLNGSKDFLQIALHKTQKMIKEGVDIIDVGGESSRPGAGKISDKEEAQRVIPVIKALIRKHNIPISVDTYKTSVAQKALDAGASIVNNIKGATLNKKLITIISKYKAAIILMHMQGIPKTMQKNTHYQNLIAEIIQSLQNSIEKCLENGINSDKIIVDPGIGFGKTPNQNLEIINRLKEFKALNQPLLIGPSRKSFIGEVLHQPVSQRQIGTVTSLCISVLNGAHIVRVHDVKAAKQAVTLTEAIINQSAHPSH